MHTLTLAPFSPLFLGDYVETGGVLKGFVTRHFVVKLGIAAEPEIGRIEIVRARAEAAHDWEIAEVRVEFQVYSRLAGRTAVRVPKGAQGSLDAAILAAERKLFTMIAQSRGKVK